MSENFIPEHGHLTEEDIRQYVQDEMPRNEVRRVDAHLEECLLCSDALEGVMSLQVVDFEQIMTSLDDKIDGKYTTASRPYQIQPVKSLNSAFGGGLLRRLFWWLRLLVFGSFHSPTLLQKSRLTQPLIPLLNQVNQIIRNHNNLLMHQF
ncbi:MAG: hypothetical protein HC817_06700 [Saprospiraceae bacterium]|nr:hypothetical protein [Saprospiraceae bacterium]